MFKGLLFFIKKGWQYDKYYILWNIFYQLINAPIPLVTAFFPKLIIDELVITQRKDRLLIYVGIFTGILLITGIFSSFFQMDGFSRRCKVAAEFDNNLHKSLYECDFENLEKSDFLELQEKSKKFLYCNYHGFGYLLDCSLNILGQCITLVGVASIVFTLNQWLVLFFLILTVLSAIIDRSIKKKIKQLEDSIISDQRRWKYFANLFEKPRLGKEFRLYQLGNWLLFKERDFFTRCNNTLKKQNNMRMQSGIISAFFTFLEQLASYVYLIICVINNNISIGSFTMYISAITVLAVSVRQILNSIVEIQSYDLYYDHLEEYLSVPSTMHTGTKNIPKKDSLTFTFENVSFCYPGSNHYVLKNISIEIHPGEKLLLVGENGAGKTTFIKLLLRLYDPTEGRILLNGIDIREFNYDCYHTIFSTVFQDYNLYSFSLQENIAMSSVSNEKEILNVLEKVGLYEKIQNAGYNLNTPIHKDFYPNGFEPSGGEGQKIAIARALYKNAPIMILDEPTAALDPRAEYDIYKQFQDMVIGKTAVYISHRLSSAKFCDKIAVFEKGSITQYGSHEELLCQKGKYAELFNMQAEFYSAPK